jgi:sialic acid synthase SpsE
MRKLARRSVVALKDIGQGEILSLDNLGLRRPGTGLPPSYLERLLGRKATRPVAKGNLLELGDCT